MNMNPFNELLDIIRKEVAKLIKPSFFIGKITNTSPISVAFEGIELSSFYINSSLSGGLSVGDTVIVLRDNDVFVVSEKVISI